MTEYRFGNDGTISMGGSPANNPPPPVHPNQLEIPMGTLPSGPEMEEPLIGLGRKSSIGFKGVVIVLLLLILGGVIATAVLAGQARDKAGCTSCSEADTSNTAAAAASPVYCDVVIVGYGPGGANTAYRLAPKLGEKLCIIDERDYVGGKILSVPVAQSTSEDPLYTPTHAEQFRQGDVIARCLAQEMGLPCVSRGTAISHYEGIFRGVNFTGVDCFGNNPVTGSWLSCASGITSDRLAANGDLAGAYPNMKPVCGDQDWTECSYCDEYFALLTASNNAASITPGETFESYARRIIGQSGLEFWTDTCGYPYPITSPADAVAYIEYLKYDWVFAYGVLVIPVGGVQQLYKRMDVHIRGNNSRVFLSEKIRDVSYSTGLPAKTHKYTLKSVSGNTYHAKRLVLAIPPLAVQALTGNIATQLQSSRYVSYSGYNRACTWNAAWETRWWNPDHTTCNTGYCTTLGLNNDGTYTIDANPAARNFSGWSFESDLGIPFAQHIGTPERQKENLLRIFFDDADCDPLNSLLSTDGQHAVTTEVMNRLRNIFGVETVPDPLSAVYSYEEYAYQLTRPGAGFTSKQLSDYAAQPLANEALCLVNEGFNMLDAGWEEAALVSSHNCFRGKVFQDLYQPGDVNGWERCSNRFTNRDLIRGNKLTENDVCLLLANEYHMRDLAGLNYCGGPSTIVAEISNNSSGGFVSSSSAADWGNAATDPVPGPEKVRKTKNRYNIVGN